MATPVIPPPPPGFTLDSAIPPPPPGFKLDAPEQANPAAANPEVVTPLGTIRGEMGENAMFNPAAALIKAGEGFAKVNRGIIEARDFLPSLIRGKPSELAARAAADREFAREPMRQLEEIHPGSTQIGDIAQKALIPAAALPVVAAMEEGSLVDRAKGAGAAYLGNKLTKEAGKYLAGAPQRAADAKAANSVRDSLVAELKAADISLAPSASGGGAISRAGEALSGKAKTTQALTVKNEDPITKIVREDLRLPPDAKLTPETMANVRSAAYDTGYKPIADLPVVNGDGSLLKGLKDIAPSATGGAIKNPARADIDEMIGAIASQGQWTGKTLVQDIQSLREQARANYGAANRAGGDAAKTALAKAQTDAAKLLENLAERNIIANGGGPGAVKALHEARTMIAKAHDVEDALLDGFVDVTKLPDSSKLSGGLRMLARGAEDKAIGPSLRRPVQGAGNNITLPDIGGIAALGALDAGVGSFALPAARVMARKAITSKHVQPFIKPDYDPGLVSRWGAPALNNPYAPALAGMYGYEMATR